MYTNFQIIGVVFLYVAVVAICDAASRRVPAPPPGSVPMKVF